MYELIGASEEILLFERNTQRKKPTYSNGMLFDFIYINSWAKLISFFRRYGQITGVPKTGAMILSACSLKGDLESTLDRYEDISYLGKNAYERLASLRKSHDSLLDYDGVLRVINFRNTLLTLLKLIAVANGMASPYELLDRFYFGELASEGDGNSPSEVLKAAIFPFNCAKDFLYYPEELPPGMPLVIEDISVDIFNYETTDTLNMFDWPFLQEFYENFYTPPSTTTRYGWEGAYILPISKIPNSNDEKEACIKTQAGIIVAYSMNLFTKIYPTIERFTYLPSGGFVQNVDDDSTFMNMFRSLYSLAEESGVKLCKQCGKPIDITGERGTPREFCGNSCKQTSTLRRRDKALMLHAQGRSAENIAKALQWDIKQIKKWTEGL